MAALSLANILTRVKYIFPSTTMDTELTTAILERMNYLVSLDIFPFQEDFDYVSLASGNYRVATPSNFATIKELQIYTAGYERPLERLDSGVFDNRFPNPSNETAGEPVYYCIKVAEGEIWFNCPTDVTYEFRIYYYKIPDDATDETVSQMVELAKIILIKWASADGFRMTGEHDRGDRMEQEGNEALKALQRRYQLAQEEGACFMSPKQYQGLYKGF